MSTPSVANEVVLVVGLMSSDENLIKSIKEELSKKYGRISSESETMNFTHTDFYESEFGKKLKKQYISFVNRISPDELVDAKHFCYLLELEHIKQNKRLISIDPGYVSETSVVLSSFKERSHRIYVMDGVYADLEMVYENKKWVPFKWTFSEMLSTEFQEFFKNIKNQE